MMPIPREQTRTVHAPLRLKLTAWTTLSLRPYVASRSRLGRENPGLASSGIRIGRRVLNSRKRWITSFIPSRKRSNYGIHRRARVVPWIRLSLQCLEQPGSASQEIGRDTSWASQKGDTVLKVFCPCGMLHSESCHGTLTRRSLDHGQHIKHLHLFGYV